MAIEHHSIRLPNHLGVPLLCLPYAGGAAGAYRDLRRAGSGGFQVVPVQLPGREERGDEPPEFSVADVADQIAPRTGRPYAIYGHSMGARLGFEVVRELRRRGLPPPVRFYVGGAHPPDRPVPLAAAASLPDERFVDQLVRRAGAQPELRDVPELRELFLPALRADFTWIKNYRYTPEPPLAVPVVAFAGLDDAEVGPPDMLGWARHTSAGFKLRTIDGGHFFLKEQPGSLARLLTEDLSGTESLEDGEIHVNLSPGPTATARTRHVDAGGVGVGVAVRPMRPSPADRDLLDPGELEQIESAAEEERDWLAARAVAAKQALASASGADPRHVTFPDLAARAPWRPGGELAPWQVHLLSVPTPSGEVIMALATSHDRVRLRVDLVPPAGWSR